MFRLNRGMIAKGLGVSVVLTGLLVLTAPAPAQAWLWSGTVTLKGSAICAGWDSPTHLSLWSPISGTIGFSFPGSPPSSYSYSHTYTNVPSKGTYVNWDLTCRYAGHKTGQFNMSRPVFGTTYPRDICNFSPGC